MLVKMILSVAYKSDTLNPGEVFDLPESVAKSMIENEMAEATKEQQIRSIMGAHASHEAGSEGGDGDDDEQSEEVKALCKKYKVEELRAMYTEKTGKKPGRMGEAKLAAAIVEASHEAGSEGGDGDDDQDGESDSEE